MLAPLAAMAAEIDAAVVCISHMTKVGGTEAMLRVMGSLGFVAAARAAYLVAKDPEDETRRLFLPMKNNIAKDRGGLAYRVKGKTLDGGIETSCVEWDAEPVTMTADEAMAAAGDPEERSELDEAADWLGKLLERRPRGFQGDLLRPRSSRGLHGGPLSEPRPAFVSRRSRRLFRERGDGSFPITATPKTTPTPHTLAVLAVLGNRNRQNLGVARVLSKTAKL